ncbi:MAG: hypothetical protein ACRDRK_10270 [Pseudonocardia sp.]
MNAIETAMWRGETVDPRLRANVTLLELLDREWCRARYRPPVHCVPAPAAGDR